MICLLTSQLMKLSTQSLIFPATAESALMIGIDFLFVMS
jgi:hypothetical protein